MKRGGNLIWGQNPGPANIPLRGMKIRKTTTALPLRARFGLCSSSGAFRKDQVSIVCGSGGGGRAREISNLGKKNEARKGAVNWCSSSLGEYCIVQLAR